MRPSRRVPLLRGFVGATIATFVALASHVWVGGDMPGMLGIAVPWLLSLTACTLLAGHRLSMLRLSASVIISQLLFHVLFMLGSITPQGGLRPHVHGAVPLSFGGDAPPLLPQDAAMWLGHAVAAALTIAALHRGELILRALLTVARAVATWLARAVPAVDAMRIVTPVRRRWAVLTAPCVREVHLGSLRRRGPPRLV
ncbi:hypothetical protein [Microbacterium arabinogalactanolyticum]|uniref:hypothetical protein n=1 Tax=Microbacterium arabinogalactanolyticum TaxID=69365 RepID=UPI0025532D89|nr:hypothetical protein [Microbacterium arabinogalactanolyticum]GLC86794.1 hypothetical protein MIAR_33790 [Microbacterium arabinogalactanolyticum]